MPIFVGGKFVTGNFKTGIVSYISETKSSLIIDFRQGSSALEYIYVSAGGLQFSGTADAVKIVCKTYDGTGNIAISGILPVTKSKVYLGLGGLNAAGVGSSTKSKSFSGTGSIVLAGLVGLAKGKSISGLGGGLLNGSATTSFVPLAAQSYVYSGTGGFALSGLWFTELVHPADEGARGGDRYVKAKQKKLAVKVFTVIADGCLGFGGEANTEWNPVPTQVHEYLNTVKLKLSGSANATNYNHGRTIRRMDADFLELLEITS